MSKNLKIYLDDILESIKRIEAYTENMSYKDFSKNNLVIDGVVRNLEIMGEAVKNLPADFRKKHTFIEWKKIAGLRDILIHEYSGINKEIIWDIVKNKIPGLKISMRKIRNEFL